MTVTVLHVKYDLDVTERLAVSGMGPMADDKSDGWRARAARDLAAKGGYQEVAVIETDELERAFALTQNLDSSWSRNPPPGVRPVGPGYVEIEGRQLGYKSTEVGDLMIFEGKTYLVDTFGFTELPPEPVAAPARAGL